MNKKIIAGLMLKNENRLIFNDKFDKKPKYSMLEQCLDCVNKIADEIIIVDNNSDDNSDFIYSKYKKIIHIKKNIETNFSDFRDRDYLISEAKKRNGDWFLMVDGDEVFEDSAINWIKSFSNNKNNENKNIRVNFKYINLWRSRKKFRIDKWNSSKFFRLWSLKNLKIIGEDLHCYDLTFDKNIVDITSPYLVIHYGWADWQFRINKSFRYGEQHSKIHNISLFNANKYYVDSDLNENGIILQDVDKNWLEEFKK